ncbi:hypothetical protein B0H16DRAFT_1513587 [Mycena metata]|uniref:Uncharacterized protein n=1 Tax=Mycena metata TaxID=1033252 RepID=A0AAD7JT10_9AGAR|nr:hypothetical protein B0H16DRAFT_1513587 [Mycena metata]
MHVGALCASLQIIHLTLQRSEGLSIDIRAEGKLRVDSEVDAVGEVLLRLYKVVYSLRSPIGMIRLSHCYSSLGSELV